MTTTTKTTKTTTNCDICIITDTITPSTHICNTCHFNVCADCAADNYTLDHARIDDDIIASREWTTTTQNHYQHGTCRRGNGTKIHFGHRAYRLDENGKQTHVSIGAACNSNGQNAGRDFQNGRDSREVTCTACNPTAPKLSPSERSPKADSCTAINNKTSKQCTFKANVRSTGMCISHTRQAYRKLHG
jgi:hypothetical protein